MTKSASYVRAWLSFVLLVSGLSRVCIAQSIDSVAATFVREFKALSLPDRDFDYRQELRKIPTEVRLHRKRLVVNRYQNQLDRLRCASLTVQEQIVYAQLQYELHQQRQQVAIELALRQHPGQRKLIINKGLSASSLGQAWYKLCVQRFTNADISATRLMQFGQQQVKRAQDTINRLRDQMGYTQADAGFYDYLSSNRFWVADTQQIITQYRERERVIQRHIGTLFSDTTSIPLGIHQWVQADSTMPPAIYLPDHDSFAFNFSTGRYNKRVMDWVFLHEGIPGHHYQLTRQRFTTHASPFLDYAYYLGNVEGWGCYVEGLGKELGLYATVEQELGRWEWDLVRSVRVVLDVGIHAKGWTNKQALAYWKAHIIGQDAIAHREIRRVTNWPGQCLSYKVGSASIASMRARLGKQPTFDLRLFHDTFLSLSSVPLNVVAAHIESLYKQRCLTRRLLPER